MIAVSVGFLLWVPLSLTSIHLLVACSLPLAVIGWIDDLRNLSPKIRLAAQFLAVGILLWLLSPFSVDSSSGAFEWVLAIVALVLGVWWLNLFNFMDGIDGIAAAQTLSMLTCAGLLAAISSPNFFSDPGGALLVLTIFGVLGFLVINWPPAKIFMGDVGSVWLAFIILGIAWTTIAQGQLKVTTWLILGAAFVTDATITLLTRMARGERWAQPHRSHAYQHLSHSIDQQRTRAHRLVTLSVLAVNLIWLAPLAWFSQTTEEPQQAVAAASLAYLPLVVATLKIGAGRPSELAVNLAVARLTTMSSFLPPRALVAVLYDTTVSVIAWACAFMLAQPGHLVDETRAVLLLSTSIVVVTQTFCFVGMRLYRGIWRFASFRDLRQIAVAVALATLIHTTLLFMLQRGVLVPRSALLVNPLLLLVLMAGGRIGYRWWKERTQYELQGQSGTPLLILGAGDAGYQVLRELRNRPSWAVIGVLDDNRDMVGREILGIRITGSWDELAAVAKFTETRHALLAVGSRNRVARRRAFELCEGAGVKLLVIPDIEEALSGQIGSPAIRDIDVDDLLGRDPVELNSRELAQMITRRVVLITGAGGSIGSDLCRQIARFDPLILVLVDASEYALYLITEDLQRSFPALPMHALVGDIRDQRRLREIFATHRPEIVFHAAAFKHVPLMEVDNAWQAVSNNVRGTLEVLDASERYGVSKLVIISTDKAVNPTNVMGATKRLAELLALRRPRKKGLQIVTVRFGNVLGSTGSVIPKFKLQIAQGGPVTVTHPDVRRYFMSLAEASQLVLQAAAMGNGGEVFVLDMGEPVKIVDLASDLIRLAGASTDDIPIRFTGLRPGEKLFEELLADGETTLPTHHPKVRISRASEIPGDDWELDVLEWIQSSEPKSDEAVRAALSRFVPEYSPFSADTDRAAERQPNHGSGLVR